MSCAASRRCGGGGGGVRAGGLWRGRGGRGGGGSAAAAQGRPRGGACGSPFVLACSCVVLLPYGRAAPYHRRTGCVCARPRPHQASSAAAVDNRTHDMAAVLRRACVCSITCVGHTGHPAWPRPNQASINTALTPCVRVRAAQEEAARRLQSAKRGGPGGAAPASAAGKRRRVQVRHAPSAAH
jgi:hypothetical protein